MPLNLQVGDSADFKVYLKTGTVPSGAVFTASSSNMSSVGLATDPTPLPVSGGEGAGATPPVPDGTPSLLSGTVTAVNPPTALGVAVTIKVVQTNVDGTTIEVEDTVTPTQTETLGTLFGSPVAPASSKSGKSAVAGHSA